MKINGGYRSRIFALIFLGFTSFCVYSQDNTLSKQQETDGWRLLFNGEDMSQWRNFKKQGLNKEWVVENGEMKLINKGGGDILTKAVFENFDLRIEWKISSAGNSGIFVLVDEEGSEIYSHAPEIQILDNERHQDNQVESHLSGSVYDMIASPLSSQKVAGQWNQVRILVKDKQLNVWQNNVLVTEILIGGGKWNKLRSLSKFSEWKGFGESVIGHIGLQDHGDSVSFKNILIKEL